jgi:Rrf2 family cysteine metabolism transcriptional repressor
MLRLSKKVEYALLALQFISSTEGRIVSAKEISDNLNISYEFLSKTLQTLMKKGFIQSIKGVNGGYLLTKDPKETSISEIFEALDESQSIASCMVDDKPLNCNRINDCSLRHPLEKIQRKIENVFNSTTLYEISGSENLNNKVEFNLNNGGLWQKN